MNGAALAPGLLFASLGLLLSFGGSRRSVAAGAILAIVAAILGGMSGPAANLAANFAASLIETAVIGCWIGVVANVACMMVPRFAQRRLVLPLCVNAGLWAGLAAAASGSPADLIPAIAWMLLCVPGGWLVARGGGIALKIAGSWLAAAAILSLGLNMTPTLGYEPDHRE